MDAGDLTHSEKLALAEVSAALNTISSQWYESQKGYHDAGVLTVTDMATSVGAMYLAQQQILERFAAQARNKGDTDLADILYSWATAYAAKEQSIKTDIRAGKAEDVVWGVIGVAGDLANNNASIGQEKGARDIISTHANYLVNSLTTNLATSPCLRASSNNVSDPF